MVSNFYKLKKKKGVACDNYFKFTPWLLWEPYVETLFLQDVEIL